MANLLGLFQDPERMGLLSAALGTIAGAQQNNPNAAMLFPQMQQQLAQQKRLANADAMAKTEFDQQQAALTAQQAQLQALKQRYANHPNPVLREIGAVDPMAALQMEQKVFEEQAKPSKDSLTAKIAELKAAGVDPNSPEGKKYLGMYINDNQDRSPYFSFLPTATGYLAGNARTGQVAPVMLNGQPVMPGTLDPSLQRKIAASKKGGEIQGETQATAAINLPKIEQASQRALGEIAALKKSPGLATATGASSVLDPRNYVPGTDAKNAQVKINQLRGTTFLAAYEQLKGAGAITEVEGKKAEDAIARLDRAQGDGEFLSALDDLGNVIKGGVELARIKAQMPTGTVSTQPPANDFAAAAAAELARRRGGQ